MPQISSGGRLYSFAIGFTSSQNFSMTPLAISTLTFLLYLLEGVQPDPKLQDMVSLVIASYNRGISGVIEDVNYKGASAFEKADYVNAVNGATLLIYKLRLQEKSQIVEIAKNKEIDRASINIG